MSHALHEKKPNSAGFKTWKVSLNRLQLGDIQDLLVSSGTLHSIASWIIKLHLGFLSCRDRFNSPFQVISGGESRVVMKPCPGLVIAM